MGRPERPLDPEAGPVQRFAFDLRSLRDRGGRLSYQELAKRAHYAPTTLSEAAKGEKLPSLEVTRAFVKACGGDPDAWERRWWGLHNQLRLQQPDRGGPGAAVAPAPAAVRSTAPPPVTSTRDDDDRARRPRRPWLAAAAVAVMAVVASGSGAQGFAPVVSTRARLVPLELLRARNAGGDYVRVWALTTEKAQALQPVSSSTYERKGKLGDCFTSREPGTVPIWHHTDAFELNGYQQHLYTIETDARHDKALKWGWKERDERPLCFVYPTPMSGTVPLYRKKERSPGESNAIGDGRGHVYTRNRKAFSENGFEVDQVWYLPSAKPTRR